MVTAKCIKIEDNTLMLKFGALWYSKARTELGFKNLSEITDRIKEFDVDFIAVLIKVAHLSYCNETKQQPVATDIEYFYNVIDQYGLISCVQDINMGIVELTGVDRMSRSDIEQASKKK